jgi:hypothetical protein
MHFFFVTEIDLILIIYISIYLNLSSLFPYFKKNMNYTEILPNKMTIRSFFHKISSFLIEIFSICELFFEQVSGQFNVIL